MKLFEVARAEWIHRAIENNLAFMRSIPSSVVRCFVDVVASVPIESRGDLWKDLITFRDQPSKFDSLSFKEELSPFRKEYEISSTWRYMPPTLKKAGARVYLSESVSSEFGFTEEQWKSRLADAGITIDSLHEAMSVKSVGRGFLRKTVARQLEEFGYCPCPGASSDFERVTEHGRMRIGLDFGHNWPGLSYHFAVKSNHLGVECPSLGSLEMALGITMHSNWDWIHSENLELTGASLVKAADVYAWICTGGIMGTGEA
jgi:hypothetical protein